jgi:hypothetical protein
MFFESNYKTISKISPDLIEAVAVACKQASWGNGNYERSEKVLSGGKLIEFPFVVSKTKEYSDEKLSILKASEPILNWIESLEQFRSCKWIRGEVATLMPGVELTWHKDPFWFHSQCQRLHVPIISNADCVQLWQGDEFHMEVGYLYELNNRVWHSAVNRGLEPRTHLILDIMEESKWNDAKNNAINHMSLIDGPGNYIMPIDQS